MLYNIKNYSDMPYTLCNQYGNTEAENEGGILCDR